MIKLWFISWMMNGLVNCNYLLNSNWWFRTWNKSLNEKICNTGYSFTFHTYLRKQFVCVCSVAPSCLILCDHKDCSQAGSSIHGIFQARILEWVAISFFRGSSWPSDQTWVHCIGRQILCHCATWEAQSNHLSLLT